MSNESFASLYRPYDHNTIMAKIKEPRTTDFDTLFHPQHPNYELYHHLVDGYKAKKISLKPLLTGITLLARPGNWAYAEDLKTILGPKKAPNAISMNIDRFRSYLNHIHPTLTVWSVVGINGGMLNNDYFHNHKEWFAPRYLIDNVATPPQFSAVPMPHTNTQDPELRELYARMMTSVVVRSFKNSEKFVLDYVFTGDERIIIDYLATHEDNGLNVGLESYFMKTIGLKKTRLHIATLMHRLSEKITQLYPEWELTSYKQDFGYHSLQKKSTP